MSEEIQTINDIDISKIKFGSVKSLESGGKKTGAKIVPVSYDGKNRFLIQLPDMRAPYGLSKFTADDSKDGPAKFSLDLSLGGYDKRPAIKKLQDFISQFDEVIMKKVLEDSNDWLTKKPKNIEQVEMVYKPMLKYSKDKSGEKSDKYPPTIKLNIPAKNNKQEIEVYDKNQQLINLINEDGSINDKVRTKGSIITAIIQISSIWISGGTNFGCSLRAVQLQVIPPARIEGFAIKSIKDDKIDSDNEVGSEDQDEDVIVDGSNIASVTIEDSDNESDEDDDSDDEEEEKVVKTPKKTVKSKK